MIRLGLERFFTSKPSDALGKPVAVIDIGSNSVRLVIYDGSTRSPSPLFNERVLCGLGRTTATTGRLGPEGVTRALAALARFRAIADRHGVSRLHVIATAAVRDAEDGPAFMAAGEAACGATIEILSGEREAALAAQGIVMGFVDADGIAGDLGGGSLELIDIVKGKLDVATTLPLGGLRLIDTTGDKMERAIDIADEAFARTTWLGQGRGRRFYAVGGTWRALAKLHMEKSGYPLRVMHGYSLPTRTAIEFAEEVRRARRVASMPGIEIVPRARREVLPYGAMALERLLKRLQPSEVIFSVFGIREGLLYGLLPAEEQTKDPLYAFCVDFARQRSRSLDHAFELIGWTDAIFAEPGPKETPEEARLRHAACLVSDVGWRAHPDYRGEQSLNLIAHSALSGIDHPGRIFLALAIYFRHAGIGEQDTDDLSSRLKALVSRRALKRAKILGLAVRTAHMLSVGLPGTIKETPLSWADGKLVLSIPPQHAALDGERLRRRFEALATLLEVAPEVRVG